MEKKEKPNSEIKDIFREVTRQIVEQTTRTRFNSALFADESSDAELSVSYSDIEEQEDPETTSTASLTESARLSTARRSYRLARAAKSPGQTSPRKANSDLSQTHPLTQSTNGAATRVSLPLDTTTKNATKRKKGKTPQSPAKSEKSVAERFKDAKKAVSKRLGFSNNKSPSSSKNASAPRSPDVNVQRSGPEEDVFSPAIGEKVFEVHQSTGNVNKQRLSDIVQRTISRHQSRHPTRNPTTDHTRAVTRSQSTKEDEKRPKRTRQKTSDRIEQHLVEAAQKLSDNVQGVYGRQPSSSTYELPLEKKFDEEFSMTDFASGPSSKGISSRSSRQSSQTSNSSAEAPGTAPMPLNTRTVSASEDIVPPTPASVTNSRPQSSLFTFEEGQLNTTIEDEAEERRQQAIASITNDLIAISNTPQFQDATSNFQTDLRNLFAPNATSLNQENAYRRLMSPLKRVLEESTNISQENLVETLIASARIIAYIPSLARFIWSYITSTLNLSIQDLDAYAQNNNDSDSDEGSAV